MKRTYPQYKRCLNINICLTYAQRLSETNISKRWIIHIKGQGKSKCIGLDMKLREILYLMIFGLDDFALLIHIEILSLSELNDEILTTKG